MMIPVTSVAINDVIENDYEQLSSVRDVRERVSESEPTFGLTILVSDCSGQNKLSIVDCYEHDRRLEVLSSAKKIKLHYLQSKELSRCFQTCSCLNA